MAKMSSPLLINDGENNMDTFYTSDNETLNEDSFFEENSTDSIQNKQYPNPYLMQWLKSKQKIEKFQFKGYVEYYKDANASKCLIKSCDRLLSCQNACNIKRHYRRMHNFVILHGKLNPFPEGEKDSSNLDKYFSYDSVTNKSFCKLPGCTKTFEGKNTGNMLHFSLGHNYKTDHDDWVNLCMLKFDRSKLPLNELITYDKRTATYRCLFLNCDYTLENNFFAIEKHYHDFHAIIFSKYTGNVRSINQFSNENIELSDQTATNATECNNSKDDRLSEDEHSTNESNSKQPTTTLKVQKNKRKFFARNYVEYCKKSNFSKCVIQNCGRLLKGLSPYNIQRHYQLLHNMYILSFLKDFTTLEGQKFALKGKLTNFVSYNVGASSYQCLFMNCNDNLQKDIDIIVSHYYEKHEIVLSKKISKNKVHKGQSSEDENEPHCSKSLIKAAKSSYEILNQTRFENFIITNYVDLNNKEEFSKCLMKNCTALPEDLEGEQTIKSHYRKVHNIHIGVNSPSEEGESSSEYGEQECIKISDHAYFDQEDASYKCLFINCNQVLEHYLPNIKKHYREKHMVIICKSSESSCRKSNHRHCESVSSENDSFSVTNELLSEDENPLQLAKRQRYISEFSPIKKEYINETGDFLINQLNAENGEECIATTSTNCNYLKQPPTIFETTLTKQRFLKSCFGLIIQHDLLLNLFDDDIFFKHLLSPYEQIINFHINSCLLLDIMLKANDMIVNVLRESFCNKVVCLELFVVNQERKYFLTVNVRFVHQQALHNCLIGCIPISKTGAEVLPISEYLNKFSIDKQQIYMTTISSDIGDDEEIVEILNNICQHNPDIKKHPIYYINVLYRSFVQKSAEEIQNWQKLLWNCNDTKINTHIFNNLNDLQRQIENLSETDIDIKPKLIKDANFFLKAIQIFSNFMQKFNEEQYVAGDFYRDLLCCELELKSEYDKNNNIYAGKLNEDLMACKNVLMESEEFLAALYLDSRFNFLGSRLLTDDQKTSGKLFLCSLWERFSKYLRFANGQIDPLENNEVTKTESKDDDDDEYALLNQHINNIMPAKSNAIIGDLISNCVAAKREPFSLDILKYWHSQRQDMNDINELTKIAFNFPSSQCMLSYLKENFTISYNDSDKIDKFLLRHNQNILDKNLELLIQEIK